MFISDDDFIFDKILIYRPFKCDRCSNEYYRPQLLKKHQKKFHQSNIRILFENENSIYGNMIKSSFNQNEQ